MSKVVLPSSLQDAYLAEHSRWCDKACDISEAMQKNGKPKDLGLGVSIVDYALDRLLKEVESNRP